MDPGNAYLMTSILTDNKARTPIFGAASPLILRDRPVAAKTGTTNDFRDGWTVGYTTQVAVGVWTGNNDNHPMKNVDGVETAGPIWNEFMRLIHAHEKAPQLLVGPDGALPAKDFARPASVVEGQSCAATGHKATKLGSNTTDLFVKGKEPTRECGELDAREQSELTQAWADFTKNLSLLNTGTPTPTPRGAPPKKIEFGRYTGSGSSTLQRYFQAVDPKYRPKGATYYNPNPNPVSSGPEVTPAVTISTSPPGRVTQVAQPQATVATGGVTQAPARSPPTQAPVPPQPPANRPGGLPTPVIVQPPTKP
jgi:membrane peptidoglycan carboxypeptidase